MTFDRYLTQNNVSFVLCDIGNNKIIKTVPEMLDKLRKLETLLLENNGITGISLNLVHAKHLREISLKGNKLNSTIPSDLLYKASLERLGLGIYPSFHVTTIYLCFVQMIHSRLILLCYLKYRGE